MKKKFIFESAMWLYPGEAANWHFISLPKNYAADIKKSFGAKARGWGSFRVEAKIGKTKWNTSIFPDKKSGTYLLPIKSIVRKAENLFTGEKISIMLNILTD